MNWLITAEGDQNAWQDFCEVFLSEDIVIKRCHVHGTLVAVCEIAVDPFRPIDSTGSMPSFVDQAQAKGFKIFVEKEKNGNPKAVRHM